jgi:hypothetical protein
MSTHYDISGTFHEACDCEIICSCWADIDPAMGECTGVYAWSVESGSVDGVVVTGGKVVILTYGPSCDDANNMLILIGDSAATAYPKLAEAVRTGPWANVVNMTADPGNFEIIQGVTITLSGTKLTANYNVPGRSVEVEAHWMFDTKAHIHSQNPMGLVQRITGQPPQPVEVGRITVPASGITGLSLLAESQPFNGNNYVFDIDITQVTAMRGSFHYRQP